jgi:hypothetical protein
MTEAMKNGGAAVRNGSRIAIEWVWRIMAFIAIPVMLYLATAINKLDANVNALQMVVSEMRGGQFTANDGLTVWQAIGDMRESSAEHTVEISELKRRVDRCENLTQDGP